MGQSLLKHWPGGEWLAEASDALVSVLFPADCRICGVLLVRSRRIPICDECLASFAVLPAPVCKICGQPLPSVNAETTAGQTCPICQIKTFAFDRARSFAAYQGKLVRAILLLKFERIEPLGGWFADRLEEVADRDSELLRADVVVPVPLHRERERERGYNQADLIARPLAKRLGLPYRPVLLVRTKPRPNKHLLSLAERWESVRGAFATCPGSQVDNLRVLLVDDVLTSGATLDACAKVLREAGAKSVIGLTVARAGKDLVLGAGESYPRDAR